MVFCGISLGYRDASLGYRDASQPINQLVTERATFEAIAEMRGFAPVDAQA